MRLSHLQGSKFYTWCTNGCILLAGEHTFKLDRGHTVDRDQLGSKEELAFDCMVNQREGVHEVPKHDIGTLKSSNVTLVGPPPVIAI